MGETGKRSCPYRNFDGNGNNQRRRSNEKEENGMNELIVYRILCPDALIGNVIGKSGKVINTIRQETRAKVKVVDPFPGANERVITIYCYVKDKEEVDIDDDYQKKGSLCPAQVALLMVHKAITDARLSVKESDKKHSDKETCHILVPTSQSANIIGKGGSTIKKLRSTTRANIKITAKDAADPTHSCAMEFDNFLLITGDGEVVNKALSAVSAIMYKFTPREQISLETTVPEVPPSIVIPSEVPIYPTGGFYQIADTIVPPRSLPPLLGAAHISELPAYADEGNKWPIYSSTLPVVSGHGSSFLSEELIFKVLCPSNKIGRVIGKGGSTIKNLRKVSGANIEVDDTKNDHDDCVITVTSTESSDDLKSVAIEAVLLLQEKINDEDDDTVTIRLLVQSKVVGCIIGKSGSIINEIRKGTKADICISKAERHKHASDSDEQLIEVIGGVASVRDALIQIVMRLRDDILKNTNGVKDTPVGACSLYNGSGLSMPSVPSFNSLGYDRRSETGSGLGMASSTSLYRHESLSMGENGYGYMPSYSSKLYRGLLPSSSYEMLIPANAVSKVIGKGGAVIANIQKISGAAIELPEVKSSFGDCIVHIYGTSEQQRTAEKLIQAFVMAP